MNEQEHAADILTRMEIAPLHAEGIKGAPARQSASKHHR
jgi:hypothetical protein